MTVVTKSLALLLLSPLALTAPQAANDFEAHLQGLDRRDEKAPYCICYDAQGIAGTQANKVTKAACKTFVQQSDYVNGFGPDPPGEGGTTAACISPKLYAKFAVTWGIYCAKLGRLAFVGGCFSADGNQHCVSDGTILPDCPP